MSKMARKHGVGATVREVAPFVMRGHYSRTHAHDANSQPWNQLTVTLTTTPGRKEGSNCTGGHHLGPEKAAVVRSRGVAAKQGFLMYYTKDVAIGPRSVSAIRRVVASQGWSLRGVPLYYSPIPIPSLYVVILNLQKISFTCIHNIIVCVLHHVTPYIATVYIYSL